MVRSNLCFDQVSFHVQIYGKSGRGKSGWTDESGLKPGYIRRGIEKCLGSGYFFGNRVTMNEMCAVENKMESRKTRRQPGTIH